MDASVGFTSIRDSISRRTDAIEELDSTSQIVLDNINSETAKFSNAYFQPVLHFVLDVEQFDEINGLLFRKSRSNSRIKLKVLKAEGGMITKAPPSARAANVEMQQKACAKPEKNVFASSKEIEVWVQTDKLGVRYDYNSTLKMISLRSINPENEELYYMAAHKAAREAGFEQSVVVSFGDTQNTGLKIPVEELRKGTITIGGLGSHSLEAYTAKQIMDKIKNEIERTLVKAFAVESFGKTAFFYTDNPQAKLAISRTALSRLLDDMDRGYETAGFLVGRSERGGIVHFEEYVPAKGVKRRAGAVVYNNRVFSEQLKGLAAREYDSVIGIHLHPSAGWINMIVIQSLMEREALNTTDKTFTLEFLSKEARAAGFNNIFSGVLSRLETKIGNQARNGAYLSVFDASKNADKVDGYSLYSEADSLTATYRISDTLKKAAQRLSMHAGYSVRSDIVISWPAIPQESLSAAWLDVQKWHAGLAESEQNKISISLKDTVDGRKISITTKKSNRKEQEIIGGYLSKLADKYIISDLPK